MLLFQTIYHYNKSRRFRDYLYIKGFCLLLQDYRKEEDMKLVSLKTDLDILSSWFRLAARSRTVDEFAGAVSEGQE